MPTHPGASTHPSQVSGTIGPIASFAAIQFFNFALAGADPNCVDGPTQGVANSCGVHIHAGTSCEADALGHYYNSALASDPWASVTYTSTEAGLASGRGSPITGLSHANILGHTFVVHDLTGARVACALIEDRPGLSKMAAEDFVPYFNYAGNLQASSPSAAFRLSHHLGPPPCYTCVLCTGRLPYTVLAHHHFVAASLLLPYLSPRLGPRALVHLLSAQVGGCRVFRTSGQPLTGGPLAHTPCVSHLRILCRSVLAYKQLTAVVHSLLPRAAPNPPMFHPPLWGANIEYSRKRTPTPRKPAFLAGRRQRHACQHRCRLAHLRLRSD